MRQSAPDCPAGNVHEPDGLNRYVNVLRSGGPVEWAIIGLLFCTAVGVIDGMLPAIKASGLNPIDALRYE